IPAVQQLVAKIVDKEPRKDVSPDECVALGAAIQASILAPLDDELEMTSADQVSREGPVIVHLTPFSLGVGLSEERYGVLIERNSTYPTEARDIFTTTRDFQAAISFPIYEGEEMVASQNTFLDMLRIDDIPPAPRGVPRIEVIFRLNQDRILEATAKDLTTNKEVTITVESTDNRLTEEEVNQLRQSAQQRVNQILEKQKKAEMANELDSLVYRARRLFSDQDDPLAEEAMRVLNELESARQMSDDESVQEKVGLLSDMLAKYDSEDY
ncbi:MAG: Hsp70 family protein, partial [Candidatus Hinthialibacter sp.]